MTLPRLSPSFVLTAALLVVLLPRFTHAFGAGNIGSSSKVEGQNWRHGDIEDTLLTLLVSRAAGGKKFKDLDVKRVYFGNWLRDYSQAVDVGTVKAVSAEAIRILLWVLGFLSFGYGTKEFEVTRDRLGCYRPEEHIDNPKDYADNIDARQYDRRLRGPVDERRELSVDTRTGLKMYIASEDQGITTSAGMLRNLFGRSIQLGRQFARSRNNADWYEALRLLGTACHCLEDFPAHSNYVELALRACNEPTVFPHVGRATPVNVPGVNHPIFPIVTGTFGGVDFLHSVCGEISDKATQSEIQELEGSIAASQRNKNKSVLQELLNKLPAGLLGGKDEAGKADKLEADATAHQMNHTHISPREPEQWTAYLRDAIEGIRPVLEFHDEIMQSISETIENIPILPELLDKLQDQINVFVFSLLAPYVLPIIKQVKAELETGSSQVIQSSREKQHIVFHDDHSSDPTHSMLSKDHFSNILNAPAGRVASQILKWAVPQIIQCMDDENADVDRTITRIINGVFHHPQLRNAGNDGAQEGRQLMFRVVEEWWNSHGEQDKNILRRQLSREGVQAGRNHKEGVKDKGHGCGKPLGMPTLLTVNHPGAIGGPSIGTVLGGIGIGSQPSGAGRRPGNIGSSVEHAASQAVGGGVVGGAVGAMVGGIMGAFGGEDDSGPGHGPGHGPGAGRGGHGGGRRPSPGRPHSPGKQSASEHSYPYGGPAYGGVHYGGDPHGLSDEKKARKEREKEEKKREKKDKRHDKSEDDDDDNDEDDYEKRARKERKKAEKERKKAEKKARKHEQGDYRSDDDDDDDDDDSDNARYPGRGGHRGGGSPHRGGQGHRGGESSYGGGESAYTSHDAIANPYASRQEGRAQHTNQDYSGGYSTTPSGYSNTMRSREDEGEGYGGGAGGVGGGRDEYGQRRQFEGDGYRQQETSGYGGRGEDNYGRGQGQGYGQEQSGQSYGQGYQQSYGGEQSSGYQSQSYGGGYGQQQVPGSFEDRGGYGGNQYGRDDNDRNQYGQDDNNRNQYGRGDDGYGPGEDQRGGYGNSGGYGNDGYEQRRY